MKKARPIGSVGRRAASMVLVGACLAAGPASGQPPAAGPTVLVETSGGVFTIETYPGEAPVTVAHILDLVGRGFYDGQRIHRVVPGLLVQWGDPRSRFPGNEATWGRGPEASSGAPIGTAEISKRLRHTRGAVGVAHPGNPVLADSQIYVMLADEESFDERYVLFGRVVAGLDVLDNLRRGDVIRRMSVRR